MTQKNISMHKKINKNRTAELRNIRINDNGKAIQLPKF